MAASGKFDLSSGSPEGSAYTNGQRGPYASGSLDRSGSFREGLENRVSSLLPSMSRSNFSASQGEVNNLLQSIVFDVRAVAPDQRFSRPGETKRAISSICGISPEDPLPASVSAKVSPSYMEELKRLKGNLSEGCSKARDRVKVLGEAISKIDKYCHNQSKKRSRADVTSIDRSSVLIPEASIPKAGLQSHITANGLDLVPQKSEEKLKTAVPNRRIRTSMVEVRMDARANGMVRSSGLPEKDKETFKLVNGGIAQSEEKGRPLASGVKKKRSVIKSDASPSVVLARAQDREREPKQGIQQKHISDARPRSNSTHGFRSGPSTGSIVGGKSDSGYQQNGLGGRPILKSDQDSGSLPNDRRDRLVGVDKEGTTFKAANRPNGREDNSAFSPTPITKLNVSARAPRSNPSSLSKASPNIQRTMGNPDDWEHPQNTSKANGVSAAINRKCSTSPASSPPVAQWGGQRPQKISRVARRSNLSPLVSGHDEFPASDTADIASANDDGSGFKRRSSSNASQPLKLKADNVPQAVLSESEDFGLPDNKARDKTKKCSEIEDKNSQTVQKVTALILPPRKNRVVAEDDLGDAGRRHGRIARVSAPTISGTEKNDNTGPIKQLRTARVGSDKIDSKPGRPPTKKFSERKGYTRPKHSVSNPGSDIAGESDDDHEEIVAAANAAVDIRHASLSPFWKNVEPIFGSLSTQDIIFLNQQIRLLDEASASNHVMRDDGKSSKGDVECASLPSTPAGGSRYDCGAVSNGLGMNDCEFDAGIASSLYDGPFLKQLVHGGVGSRNGVSICQALLSAIIEEEDIEEFCHITCKGEEFFNNAHVTKSEGDAELSTKASHLQPFNQFQASEATSNGYKACASWRYHGELPEDKFGGRTGFLELNAGAISSVEHPIDGSVPNQTMRMNTAYSDFQYSQMNIDDRILLELNAIGLYPEPVPDLSLSEDEEIGGGIDCLEDQLHVQVMKKKNLLLNLKNAVVEAREHQERELERIALDKLLGSAYERYMACWGPNTSGSKNVNKSTRQSTIAFVKRTLARCQKFEEMGTSCFSDPAFREIFSISSHKIEAECLDTAADGVAAKLFAPSRHSPVTGHNLPLQPVQGLDSQDNYSNSFRPVSHLSEQSYDKEEPFSNRGKKRELLLDEVVGSSVVTSLRAPSGLGSSLVSGTKGKRSGRDREGKGQNRDTVSRNGTAKIGRPSLSNVKSERKNKTKSKQKTTQLSASVSDLHNKAADLSGVMTSSGTKSQSMNVRGSIKSKDELMHDNDADPIDLSHLQLPELDAGYFEGQGQDFSQWLNIDNEALQEDFMDGLEIPMDDLSEIMMA